ncbi:MAG: hypothetical protein IAG13_25675, partial [Deltaproteobacteria bacterium]|nr:hypothetical protein [Nannocystaceae bacterium]
LPLVDGVVKRDTFAEVFALAACELNLGITDACDATAPDCCTAGEAPGCSDSDCADTVCELWPECCELAWSAECAAQASEWACSCA